LKRVKDSSVGLVALIVLVAGLLLTAGLPARAAETTKIGFVISITGPYGFIGTPQKEIIEAAVADVNKRGGINGKQLEALIEDDKGVPTNAVIAATKLIRDKEICALIAASSSDSSAAIIPIADQEKVPYIVTAPIVNPNKRWVFIVGPGDVKGAAHYLDYAVTELKAKKLALLSEVAVYGKTGSETILKEYKKYPGVSIVAQEKVEMGDTNLIPQLTRIKAANADLLLLYATANTAAVAAKNFKQLGMTMPVLGSNAITIPAFVKAAGDIAEEKGWILFTLPFNVAEKMSPTSQFRKTLYDPLKKVIQDYFGPSRMPNNFHASTYDTVNAIAAALKLAGSDNRDAVRDALEKVRVPGFLGVFAPTPQDHYGSAVDPMVPVVMKGGEWVPYQGK
jgi:branched-chain amino acid transport system substrate-binding protein